MDKKSSKNKITKLLFLEVIVISNKFQNMTNNHFWQVALVV
jgi:hypothetical protein